MVERFTYAAYFGKISDAIFGDQMFSGVDSIRIYEESMEDQMLSRIIPFNPLVG